MIILDSNILKGTSLRGPEAELIRAIRATRAERVAAPWIVMEELAAQQALAYEKKHDDAVAAIDALSKATPWGQVKAPPKADSEYVRAHWRKRYAAIVDTLPTSPDAYEQAMFREANLLAPCKTVNSGKHKTGSRDAAIWLTAVQFARQNPTEVVYFVSNNTEDFGDGSSFPAPMDEDLRGIEDRFVLFTSLGDVLMKFATEVDADEAELRAFLKDDFLNHRVIERAAMAQRNFTATIETAPGVYEDALCSRWWRRGLRVRFDAVDSISAYEIAGHRWYTATTRWLISGIVHSGADLYWGHCVWETRVLLSPTASSKGLTVTVPRRLVPPAAEDMANVAPYPYDFGSWGFTDEDIPGPRRRPLGLPPTRAELPYSGALMRQATRQLAERYRAEHTDDMLPMDD